MSGQDFLLLSEIEKRRGECSSFKCAFYIKLDAHNRLSIYLLSLEELILYTPYPNEAKVIYALILRRVQRFSVALRMREAYCGYNVLSLSLSLSLPSFLQSGMDPSFIMATASKPHVPVCMCMCVSVSVSVSVCVCVSVCAYKCSIVRDVRMSEREERKKLESCGALPYIYATYKKIKKIDKSTFCTCLCVKINLKTSINQKNCLIINQCDVN